MIRPRPLRPEAGQESVWDYPRPPRLEPMALPVSIRFGGREIARTAHAVRVLETSHPPVPYLPSDAFLPGILVPATGGSFCEWKGWAVYFDIVSGDERAERAAWAYPAPTAAFATIAGFVAVYPALMDACFIGDERVTAQPGGFYGGWITRSICGPFKGEPGSAGW